MLPVTRFDKQTVYVNPHLIESIEETPDVVLTLVNGKKLIIKESVTQVVAMMRYYERWVRMPLDQKNEFKFEGQ